MENDYKWVTLPIIRSFIFMFLIQFLDSLYLYSCSSAYVSFAPFLTLCHFLLQRRQAAADEATLMKNMLKQQEEMQREQIDVGAMRCNIYT